MEMLILLLRICLVFLVLVAGSSSGLDSFPPLSSPPSPLPETSQGLAPVSNSPSESHNSGNSPPPKASQPSPVPNSPSESHNSGNPPPPKASQPSLPPLANIAAPPPLANVVAPPPFANVAAPPPSVTRGTVLSPPPVAEPIVSVPNAPAPVKDLPANSPVSQPNIPIGSPPQSIPDAPKKPPISGIVIPGPVSSPIVGNSPLPSVSIPPATPSIPPSASPSNSSNNQKPPVEDHVAPVAAPPPTIPIETPPPVHTIVPDLTPANSPVPILTPKKGSPVHTIVPDLTPANSPVPILTPKKGSPRSSPTIHPIFPIESPALSPDHPANPVKDSPPSDGDDDRSPVQQPSNDTAKPLPVFPHKDSPPPSVAPLPPKFKERSYHHNSPSTPSPDSTPSSVHRHSPVSSSPLPSHHPHHQKSKIITTPAPAPPHLISPRNSKHKGSTAPSPLIPDSLASPPQAPMSSPVHHIASAPSPSPTQVFPLRSSSKEHPIARKFPLGPPLQAFPPPPPNADCKTYVCLEPYTNTPPGSPCGCVWPIQVELQLSIALYDFFPMVSEFAREIGAGVFMKQSQVRIMGANEATDQPEKSIVLIDLVPLGDKFDNLTAMLTYQRFWSKKVNIDVSTFGEYDVLYVRYPGLPASPPFPPSGMSNMDQGPYLGGNGRAIKPIGVDVPKKSHKKMLNVGSIAVIVLSAAAFIGLCFITVWFLIFRQRARGSKRRSLARPTLPSLSKPSGSTRSLTGSRLSSNSLSFESSIAPFTLSAKTFTASEIAKATKNFDESRVLGEGGFGRVYEGVFEDGTKVAVKVLKRDDQQGSREFLAEVEMLSRLHHRNLVNLIGICIEDRNRSLVYELIPNGSVESHLHGVDKESSPLDWDARLKIALGAARGLAYLHEDSSPRVIHRDFKSSNILLEHDFTPKVSDFGLARNALDEDNRHISTRVMGTFGYVAPEYAMTGHLLVKSDVYSYGVVLLELLTGRKPVDMSQPPGQENLVSWTRSFLTSREGLEAIIDQSLGPEISFDSIAKVAAIASMCVQPEVSHRPFMGEVVQALKLVCNECDEAKEHNSVTSTTQEDLSMNTRAESSCGDGSGRLIRYPLLPNYDSEPDTERGETSSGSVTRHSNSGPLISGQGKKFWQKMRRLSTGSLSEHGTSSRMLRSDSH